MSNNSKKIVSIIGIIVGIVIIIIGFCVQNASGYPIGKEIMFGADFYTEIYDVTKDVGRAVNKATYNLAEAIGWLIVSLGAIDICLFSYLLVKSIEDVGAALKLDNICRNLNILATPMILEAEEKAKREAEEKTKREMEENERLKAEIKRLRTEKSVEEKVKREREAEEKGQRTSNGN